MAVLGVLAYHDDHLSGGFLGVDLFFVLSGFLITGLVIDHMAIGTPHPLREFWSRRLRRLTPAVLVLIAVVVTVGRLIADPSEWIPARHDAPWAQFYVANWHHIVSGSDYWDRFASPSPFEHLWSLAIEEQFYLVWPLVIVALVRWKRPTAIAITAAVGIVASALAMAALVDGANPTRVYMGTDTRAFSLLLGAVVATPTVRSWISTHLTRYRRLGAPLVWSSLAGIGAMWALTSGSDTWLFRGGILAHALLSAVAISTVVHDRGFAARCLGARPFTYVGRLSYSLYLWHWPIDLYLTSARTGLDGWALSGLRLAITGVISVASYHLIEFPLRYRTRWTRGRLGLGTYVLAMALVATSWLVISVPSTTNAVTTAALEGFADSGTTTTVAASPSASVDILASWPNVAIHTVFYLGDSIASDIWPAVDAAFSASGVHIESGAFGGVGLVASADNVDPLGTLARRLDDLRPDLLIVQLSVWDAQQSADKQIAALRAINDMVVARNIHLVLLSFPPLAPERREPGQRLLEMRAHDLALRSNGSIAYLDTTEALGSTFAFDIDFDGIPERKRDGIHVCPTGALIVAQWLSRTISSLAPMYIAAPSSQWAFGDWRTDARYDSPPGACAVL